MPLLEALFLLVLALAIIRLLAGPRFAWLTYPRIAVAGLVLAACGLLLGGWRWQMWPAGLAFLCVLAVCWKRSESRLGWRLLGAVPLILLVGISALLTLSMPMVKLPEPTGRLGVGTFEFSITDQARTERYAPERQRELYAEVWYPADKARLQDYPVRSLFHSLYAGKYSRPSFLFGYLKDVDTHSHIHAQPALAEGPFPVLLFNHALDFGFTAQNQRLMEHLASNGYVVVSIAHPYQSSKVNLAQAGTVLRANRMPADIALPRPELLVGIIGPVLDKTGDIHQVSRIKALLYPLAERYLALEEKDRPAFLAQAVESAELQPFREFISVEKLEDFVHYDYIKDNSLAQYWVEDNQFILDSLATLQTPVTGFANLMDIERVGVFGMSFGGSAAGEFCKIDRRCVAGANLDGTQFGAHWNQPMPAPFLMLYHDGHEGGNDFAYSSPTPDFREYTVKGTTHMDFTDFVYLWPGLKLTDFSGSLDGRRTMEVLNAVVLDFFDQYLKGKTNPDVAYSGIPEIAARVRPR